MLWPNMINIAFDKAKACYFCYHKILLRSQDSVSPSYNLQDHNRFHMQILVFDIKIKFGDSSTRKRFPEISMTNTPNHMLLKKLTNPKFQAR